MFFSSKRNEAGKRGFTKDDFFSHFFSTSKQDLKEHIRESKANLSLPRRRASSSANAWPGASASVARIIRDACTLAKVTSHAQTKDLSNP